MKKVLLYLVVLAINLSHLFAINENILFIENRGQVRDVYKNPVPEMLFSVNGKNTAFFLRKSGFSWIQVIKHKAENPEKILSDSISRIDIEFLNTRKDVNVYGVDKSSAQFNYYLSHCPDGITNVPAFNKVIYKNLYDKIDLVIYSRNGDLEYDFVVYPGGNPEQIEFEIRGAEGSINGEKGSLIAENILTKIENLRPYAYQDRESIAVNFEYRGNNQFQFNISEYDKSKNLIIDPVIPWSCYAGGTKADYNSSVGVDRDTNIISGGASASIDVYTTPGVYQLNLLGDVDMMIQKYSLAGDLEWSTYFGGEKEDNLKHLTMNSSYICIAGETNGKFPVTSDAIQDTVAGQYDGVIVLLDHYGKRKFATIFGGSHYDAITDAEIDGNGNIIAIGRTDKLIPVTSDAEYPYRTGIGYSGFIIKISSSRNLVYSSFMNGNHDDFPESLMIDKNGDIIVGGFTKSVNFMYGYNRYQKNNAGDYDAFIVKYNNSCKVIWSTYYGGSGYEQGTDVVVDKYNNIYLRGVTSSTNLPVKGYQKKNAGGIDAFVAKFDQYGDLKWSTYLGGSSDDGMRGTDSQWGGIAINSKNEIAIAGFTKSTNFPYTDTLVTNIYGWNIFLASFDANGGLIFSAFFGGEKDDFNKDIYYLDDYNIMCVGVTSSNKFPIYGNSFNEVYLGGETDGYLLIYQHFDLPDIYFKSEYINTCVGDTIVRKIQLNKIRRITELEPVLLSAGTSNNKFKVIYISKSLPTPVKENEPLEIVIRYIPGDKDIYVDTLILRMAVDYDTINVYFPFQFDIVKLEDITLEDVDIGDVCVRMGNQRGIRLNEIGTINDSMYTTVKGVFSNSEVFSFLKFAPNPGLIVKSRKHTAEIYIYSEELGEFEDTLYLEMRWRGCKLTVKFLVKCNVVDAPVPKIIGRDKLCPGDTIWLTVKEKYSSYEWSTGEKTRTIIIDKEGIYTVKVTNEAGCEGIDQFEVKTYDDLLVIEGNKPFCKGDSIKLWIPHYYWNIVWSTGSNDSYIYVKDEGVYSVSATDTNGCRHKSKVSVKYLNPAELKIDGNNPLCEGDSARLYLSKEFDYYQWSTGDTCSSIIVKNEGYYYVYVEDKNGCIGKASIYIEIIDMDNIKITGDTLVCYNEEVIYTINAKDDFMKWTVINGTFISGVYPSSARVRWNKGDGDGWVIVKGNYNKCEFKDTIKVRIREDIKFEIKTIPADICVGDTAILYTDPEFNKIKWSTGDTSKTIKVFTNKMISAQVIDDYGCTGSKTQNIFFDEKPLVNINGPDSLCTGSIGVYNLTGTMGKTRYEITGGEILEGDSSRKVTIKWTHNPARIKAIVNSENSSCEGFGIKDIYLEKAGTLAIIASRSTICKGGEPAILSVPEDYEEYLWSTGEKISSITVKEAGKYWVDVMTRTGCKLSDTVEIYETDYPDPVISGDEFICPGGSTTLKVDKNYSSYLWSTGDTLDRITVSSRGIYSCEVKNESGCRSIAKFEVKEFKVDLTANPAELDFGSINYTSSKVEVITVKNNSNIDITLTGIIISDKSFEIVSPNLPISIRAGAIIPVSIKFTPDQQREFNASIIFKVEPCSNQFEFSLKGNCLNLVLYTILPDTTLDPGSYACIPVYAKMEKGNLSGVLSATISMNIDLFDPEIPYLIENKEMLVRISENVNLTTEKQKISEICGIVLMAENDLNPLIFTNVEFSDPNVDKIPVNGSISLGGICEQDLQLLEVLEELNFTVNPNPSNSVINLSINSEKETALTIALYNVSGRVVYNESIISSGKDYLTIDLSSFSNGIYQLVVETPWEVKAVQIGVVK